MESSSTYKKQMNNYQADIDRLSAKKAEYSSYITKLQNLKKQLVGPAATIRKSGEDFKAGGHLRDGVPLDQENFATYADNLDDAIDTIDDLITKTNNDISNLQTNINTANTKYNNARTNYNKALKEEASNK